MGGILEMSLTTEELHMKIKMVEADILSVTNEHGRAALSEYLDYLKDELKTAEKKDNIQ
jgi:hypothetical protein